MEKTITLEQQYNHPITEVWRAISEEKSISDWFIKADFKPEVGYHYKFTHEDTVITGKVLVVDPTFNLRYTWTVGGTGVETIVHWKLEENEQGTLLKIEHSGIENYPTEEMAINMFNGFIQGWTSCVENLTKYLIKV